VIVDIRTDACPMCGGVGGQAGCRCCGSAAPGARSVRLRTVPEGEASVRYGQLAPPMNVGGDINSPRTDAPDDGVTTGSLIHQTWSGTHSHPHAAHDGPDLDGDGVHGHPHSHDGSASHDHDHEGVADVDDGSLYEQAAEAGGASSSAGRRPYGYSRMDQGTMLMPAGMSGGATLNERLSAAERLCERTAKDWDDAVADMDYWRSQLPDYDLAGVRHLNPEQRHLWVAAMNAEGACAAADRAHQRARANLERLYRDWDAISRTDMSLPPGAEHEFIGIRGRQSLYGGGDSRTATRTFDSPIGLGGRDGQIGEPTRGDVF
jgi:hypothetical protein